MIRPRSIAAPASPPSASVRRVVFVSASPPGPGLQSEPVLRRHLARLARRVPVICAHFRPPSTPPPPGVELFRMPLRRWFYPPVRSWLPGSLGLNRGLRTRHTTARLDLGPEDAVLCCVHADEPVIAADLARHSGASLHLLVHDAWPQERTSRLSTIFRQASSVLVASEDLAEMVAGSFGVASRHLPPIGEDPLPAVAHPPSTEWLGVAGSIDREYIDRALALGHPVLTLGGPSHPNSARVRHVPRLPENLDALRFLQKECRALFVHQSDRPGPYERYAFPSRLVDFAQTGLPLILRAPPSSSLGRWASDRAWRTHIRGDDDTEAIARARRIFTHAEDWHAAATRALAEGEFASHRIHAILEDALGIAASSRP